MSENLKNILLLTSLILVAIPLPVLSQDIPEEQWNKNLEGMTIRNINIVNLNVAEIFDAGIVNTDSTWLNQLANSVHYKTRYWVIKDRLLFEEGEKINFGKLYESERILRNTNLFIEVKINIHPVLNLPGMADVEVITKDRWTLTYLAKYNPGSKSGYLGLKDNNLIGLGHTADAVITYNDDPSINWGGRFRYMANNINGSFIDAGLRIEANKKFSLKSLSVQRPFITTEKEWIGGAELRWEQSEIEIRDTGNILISKPVAKKSQDLWAGKVFQINLDEDLFKKNSNLITSARVYSFNFTRRPFNPFQYRIFENSTLLLFGSAFITRSYYKDKFIQDFGITEDIPVGGSFNMNAGIEERELSDRWYLGFETIYSEWFDEFGYLSGRIGFGTFKSGRNWEQRTINLNVLYHSYLYRWKIWTYRIFARYDLITGYDRLSGEKIYLYSRTGLRGIDKIIVDGTKRMVINTEARIFSPYQLLGFAIGGIAFADFGLIADEGSFFSRSFFQAYGAGLRIKNESIINAAFEIVFVFNPYHPENKNAAFSVLFSTNFSIGLRDIGYSKPFIEPF